ncbi:MAG TPA: O-antigen ligase family protein [Gemmatimonadaceae bacterium]|nr:O-antigen ligase family protein [Gemmatimonadaceae bacterium]
MRLSSLVRFRVPPLTVWRLFVLLLVLALGSEYWDKNLLEIGTAQIPWPRFLAAMLLAPLLVIEAHRRWADLFRVPRPLGPLIIFWLCCAVSLLGVFLSPPALRDPLQFVQTLVHLTLYIVLVYVIVKSATWPRLFLLVKSYYVLGVAAACLALLQFLQGTFGIFPWIRPLMFQSGSYEVGAGLTVGFRASSIFGEPSWAARYYLHWMALALGYWWHTRDRRHLAALGLFVLAFYVANSLLGYVMLLVFAGTIVVAQMRRKNMFSISQRQRIGLSLTAYALFLFWLVGAAPPLPDLLDRTVQRVSLVRQGGGGSGNRFDSIFAGLEVWKRAPLFGVGLGNVGVYIVDFYRDQAYIFRSRYGSDSLYVQLLSETGIIGLAGFLWLWAGLLRAPRPPPGGWESPEARQGYAWMRILQIDLFAQAVGMLNYSDYLHPHLWTIVAIVLACKTLLVQDSLGQRSAASNNRLMPALGFAG